MRISSSLPVSFGKAGVRAGGGCILHHPAVHRQEEDSRIGEDPLDVGSRLDAVHLRHLDIHQDHAGPEALRLVDGVYAVYGLSNYGDAGLADQYAAQAVADGAAAVYYQYSYGQKPPLRSRALRPTLPERKRSYGPLNGVRS